MDKILLIKRLIIVLFPMNAIIQSFPTLWHSLWYMLLALEQELLRLFSSPHVQNGRSCLFPNSNFSVKEITHKSIIFMQNKASTFK